MMKYILLLFALAICNFVNAYAVFHSNFSFPPICCLLLTIFMTYRIITCNRKKDF